MSDPESSVARPTPPTWPREPDWSGHCAEPVAEHIARATGKDPWALLGGCPRSARAAAALYRRHGVTNLKDMVTRVLGPPVDRKLARRGDIALLASPGGGFCSLGIVRGESIECIDAMQPLAAAHCCWHVNRSDQP